MKKNITATIKEKQSSAALQADAVLEELQTLQSDTERQKILRYFKTGEGQYSDGDVFIGVRMGDVFALAKQHMHLPLAAVECLLENDIHEARVVAVSIMDFQARSKKTTPEQRKALYTLYLKRHDRINNWDLVDRSAPHVVGGYLYDQPRDMLYKLARSKNMWERRTAIVSTAYFIKKGDVSDTFRIAGLLLQDKEDLLHKAAGGWLREAGKKAHEELCLFLESHATTMPRTMLRYAVEHFDKSGREHYLSLKQEQRKQ